LAITLWPGESQELTASYDASLLNGTAPKVIVSGWNVPEFNATG
jgi:exo-1,4-beta-D-glucosaminidase